MKFLLPILFAVLSLPVIADLKIVTTTPDFADLARQIGGDKVSAHSVMKGPENVHNVLPLPTEMLKLNQADLFVHTGLDAEPWRDNLVKGARNPRIAAGRPGNVDMSANVDLKDVPTAKIGRDQGDVHAHGNPHFQLDPVAAQKMAVTLAKAMIDADPPNADLYRQNTRKVVTDFAAVAKDLQQKMAPHKGLKVVTFHPAWAYFADAFGLDVAATIEPKPSITPSPAQVRRLIEKMKADGVKIVIVETYSDPKLAQFVAARAGAKLLTLPDHVNGVKEADTYQNLFKYNVTQLIEAAEATK